MMATVPRVTSGLGLRKFQADGFLLPRVYQKISFKITGGTMCQETLYCSYSDDTPLGE